MLKRATYYEYETQHLDPVWPAVPPRELSTEVPEPIRSLFREASVAENAGALRGAAGLYRATVEAICDEEGVAKGKLQPRVNQLSGRLDEDLVQNLHEARLIGNWSLHEGLSFSREELEDVALLIVDAVEALYVIPAKKRRMREARAARRERGQDTAPEASG